MDDASEERWREVRFRHSPSFVEVLRQMRCTLLVSTYQAGKLIAVGHEEDRLHLSFHEFDQAMGVAARRDRVAVGTTGQVWFLGDQSRLAPVMEPQGRYDRCYLARSATVTGGIQCHELAWGADDELWVVNTRFSCLATLHPDYHFVPRWRPPFVTRLAAEDRCHLNGLGMRDGKPSLVTVLGRTDEPGGWRGDKNAGGCVLDVASGEPVTSGLAMPHSPRWHDGRMLVLNSGHGTIESVDPGTGARTAIEAVPGFTRGLACHGNLAFVGLSRIRETAVFGGVPIAARHEELKCGVGVVDLISGTTVATLEFETGIEEIFDVQVVPDTRCVALSGGRPGEEDDIWVVPPEPAPDARTLNDRGNALQDAGDQEGALAAYRQALAADPAFAPALQNLGYLLVQHGHTAEGRARLLEADRVRPAPVNRVMAATALPVVYADADEVATTRARMHAEVEALVAAGARIDTTDALVPTGFFTAYQGGDQRAVQAGLGRIYHGPDLARPRGRSPGVQRVRVGFLSAYFRDHTIGRLNLGRIQRLDRERFEVVVLTPGRARDPMAEAFRSAADTFVQLPQSVAAAREQIAAQALEVLVFADVGMDALTSTLAHSRMAPVQVATWGHPLTTGSATMDHYLSSALLETPDAQAHYTERLALPPTLCTYYERPPRPEGELVLPGGHRYACPQTLFKFHPDFDAVLAGILRGDPDGVLLLIEGRVAHWTALLRERFARVMPDVTDRIHWLPGLPRPDYLRLLAQSDVVLDPFPFGGGNSSYEAFAMGAPIVTLPGAFLRGNLTAAMYSKTGRRDLVATSPEDYVEIALRAGAERARLGTEVDALFGDDAEVRDLEDALALLASADGG